jgi:hypothetical protein
MSSNMVAYRPVAEQRPRNGQRVQSLLCNGRINTHLYATVEVLLVYNNANGVFYVFRIEILKLGHFEAMC